MSAIFRLDLKKPVPNSRSKAAAAPSLDDFFLAAAAGCCVFCLLPAVLIDFRVRFPRRLAGELDGFGLVKIDHAGQLR